MCNYFHNILIFFNKFQKRRLHVRQVFFMFIRQKLLCQCLSICFLWLLGKFSHLLSMIICFKKIQLWFPDTKNFKCFKAYLITLVQLGIRSLAAVIDDKAFVCIEMLNPTVQPNLNIFNYQFGLLKQTLHATLYRPENLTCHFACLKELRNCLGRVTWNFRESLN